MARRRMRTTRTRPRARRDGGGEHPRDDHKETLSRPTGYDRDQAIAPRIEVTLVESEETTHFGDGCRAGVVLEDAGERIVRRDDEVEFAVAGKRFEPRADVEDAARLEPLDESLPLGRVVAETDLHKVAAGREHTRSRAPAVPAVEPRRPRRGGSTSPAGPPDRPAGRSRT